MRKRDGRNGTRPRFGEHRRPWILCIRLRSINILEFVDYIKKGKGSPYSITERRVPELIPVLSSQPTGDVSRKPGGRLPLLSARPQLPPQPLRRLLPILLLGE